MKTRILALILIICLCFGTIFTGQIVSAAKMRGDLNFDDFINAKDSLLLRKHLADSVVLDEDALKQADCNNDGTVNVKDAQDLIGYLVKTGELHIDLDEGWNALCDWETVSQGTTPSGTRGAALHSTLRATLLSNHTVQNTKNPFSTTALALKPFGVYYKGAENGSNPTVGTDPSGTITVDTTKTSSASNLRVLMNFAPVLNELAVVYIGFQYNDLQKYYTRVTLESYADFNYFYFADKTYTKYVKGYRRTYLEDDVPETFTLTKDMIKNIKSIYFWIESDRGTKTDKANTKGLIIDDIEYFEGENGYDSTADDAALPKPAKPVVDGTKYMAISFDDGPQVYSPTGKHFIDYYMDVAKEYDAKFSYFVIGSNCDETDVDVLKRAVQAGHAIENHTIDHSNLISVANAQTDYTQIIPAIAKKITDLDDWLYKNVGVRTQYIRPPFLAHNGNVYEGVKAAGLKACIGGPCPADYNEPSVDYKELYYEKNLGDGVISLNHEHYIDNVETIRRILEHFSARGYKFVTIDELFEIKGVEPAYNKLYSTVE